MECVVCKELERKLGRFAKILFIRDLSLKQKFLLVEVHRICSENGVCNKTNEYFAKNWGFSKKTLPRLIKKLCERGYLNRELFFEDGSKIPSYRKLTINYKKIDEEVYQV